MARTDVRVWAALLGLMLGVLYANVIPDLVRNWDEDPNYSHGLLVPFISAFAVWRMRAELKQLRPQPTMRGIWLLAIGVAMLLVGSLGAEFFLTRSSLVVILAGLVLVNLGREFLVKLAFPIGNLIFMIPLPAVVYNGFAFPLQRLAARCSAWALEIIGIPVLLEGNMIHLSHFSLGVTEACSGLRSLISLMALAAAWAHFALSGRWAKLALVVAAIPIAVLTNVFRVIATAIIAQVIGLRYAEGFFHGVSGLLVFLIALAILLGASRIRVGRRTVGELAPTPTDSAPAPSTSAPARIRLAGAISFALLLIPVLAVRVQPIVVAVPLRAPLREVPAHIGGWRAMEDVPLNVRTQEVLQASDVLTRRYSDAQGNSLWLYIGYWETQRRGAISHSPRNCLPGSGWMPLSASRLVVPLKPPLASITVNRYLVQKGEDRELVLYWYMAQGDALPGEVHARLAMMKSSVLHHRTDGAIVRVSGRIAGDEAEALERLVQYVQELYPLLDRYLPE